ncbi:MAG: hypothetical protein J6U54_15965 [Clostridiales bacterium]|nr:hypothetical protein [Clostridiales bacterium]
MIGYVIIGGLIASSITAYYAKKREQENKEFEKQIQKDIENILKDCCNPKLFVEDDKASD